ncbi:MAG: hydantoinase/oxoprolinase family protein [Candidatus Binataceae bacterium]|nr:hydantoinase/oxoprolinase family protein [Candidatus Binataceae bacterium]
MGCRLGVDVGGTFTDLLLINESNGATFRAKVPSTPGDQAVGVLEGIRRICAAAAIAPGEIAELMHGTTVATNAILEGRGARVGLIVTDGYRQVLQIARSYVPGGLGGWIIWTKPEPLAALEDTVEVKERIGVHGEVVRPLEEASVVAAVRQLKHRAVRSITVSLINSFVNDAHERRVREIAEREMPGAPVSISSEILPEMREYERTLTTVANSYVRPTVARYLGSLSRELARREVDARLKVLRSDGGLMSFEAAERAPVNLLMSGPAGGVAGAVWAARQAGFDNLLTFDMGGTSTDVALVEAGEPRVRRETRAGDVTVRASSLDVRTIGAGGGSIASVPEFTRALRVGPRSAGAEPGPAAYGKGGVDPTVTDANVTLGYLPSGLLGGEMQLDREAARAAVQKIADAMGIGLEHAATGIIGIVNENMFGALRLVSIEQGYDPRDFALVAFGGAGPLHANALGLLLGCWPVIIPPSPGVLCAYGDATTRTRNEAARTFIRRFKDTSNAEVGRMLGTLAETAAAALDAEGVPRADQSVVYQVDVRYHGQGFELPINVEIETFAAGGIDAVERSFDEAHRRLFTFALEVEHEFVNLRAIVQGRAPVVRPNIVAEGDGGSSAAKIGDTPVWIEGGRADAALYDRAKLKANNRIRGPAIVTEFDATTLILPGCEGQVDRFGNILIKPISR